MRRAKDLDDNVNVHRAEFKRHGKATGSVRVMPDTLDSPDPYVPEHDTVPVEKSLDISSLFSGEMTLGARTSTGEPAVVKIPHAFVGAIVVITLALISGGYWLVSTLARLDANTTTIMRQQERTFTHLETQKAYIDAQTGQVKFMQGLLTRENQQAFAEYQKANPMPATPNTETVRPDWMKEN